MSTSARGIFEVALTPQPLADPDADPGLARLAIAKQFQGDLTGASNGEMLSVRTQVEGSAGYVAVERFSGTLHGRRGSFVLLHRGVMDRGGQQLQITVVPDSASDELVGLSGSMLIIIDDGIHHYDFTYTLGE